MYHLFQVCYLFVPHTAGCVCEVAVEGGRRFTGMERWEGLLVFSYHELSITSETCLNGLEKGGEFLRLLSRPL